MKYLGIDYGTKRIGLAFSDDRGSMAFPKSTLENSQNIINDIINIVETDNIESIVIGKSLDQWGNTNKVQQQINNFINQLSVALPNIKIIEQDERGSSIAAASHLYSKGNIANAKWTGKGNAKKREHNDANAATVILQRFLDIK